MHFHLEVQFEKELLASPRRFVGRIQVLEGARGRPVLSLAITLSN